mgnify:FL=1
MKSNKGITLIIVIMTVVLLTILMGLVITSSIDTYNKSKFLSFETNMKLIQKKVDMALEERIDYETLGQPLNDEQRSRLATIIANDNNNMISTEDPSAETLRYFSSNDINEDFELSDIRGEFVINFANREVISLDGAEKNNVMYYTI